MLSTYVSSLPYFGACRRHEVELVPLAGAVLALLLVGEREGVDLLGRLEAEVVLDGRPVLVEGDLLVVVDDLLERRHRVDRRDRAGGLDVVRGVVAVAELVDEVAPVEAVGLHVRVDDRHVVLAPDVVLDVVRQVQHVDGFLPVELELGEELVEGLELPAVRREDALAGPLVDAVPQRQLEDLRHRDEVDADGGRLAGAARDPVGRAVQRDRLPGAAARSRGSRRSPRRARPRCPSPRGRSGA